MNNQQSKPSTRGLGILPLTEGAITLVGWMVMAFSGNYALAQISPDQTLGNESSVVTPNLSIRGEPGDLIEGGAARGSNLFHSFQDFNVGQLQRVYFANPAGIENILSRVTGSNISNILGTLGVDGGANLFLLNPNGIVFGQNARLDVAGSFVASTANSLVFNNGTEFSATNPQAPPLLSINITPGLQYGLNHPKPIITNGGYLVVGQDLTLAAGNLDLQGQLIAGGDVTLHGEDTVQIRDSIGRPFIAAAGGKLLIQGNQGVDIFALNHPDSGLFSGGDLVLRSQNTVAGDAHYWSGGSFRIEQLDGSLGDLFSPDDPIIRSVGDVSFNSYLGTSLHIVAGGAVEIGSVIITGSETGTEGIDFISEAITLSNGTVVNINGQTEPTLDIRAGVDPNQVDPRGLTGKQFRDIFNGNIFFGRPTITDSATSADIKIGTIAFTNLNDLLAGTVLLTNQYKPNPLLAGDIEVSATLDFLAPNLAIQNGEVSKGGSVTIDSRGSITLNGIVNTIAIPNNDASNPFSGNGGDVTFLANENITLNPGSFIASAGIVGGNITLNSGSNFLLDDSGVVTVTTGAGVGGNLIVNAPESVTLINREGSGFKNLGNLVNEFTNSDLVEQLLGFEGSGLATVTIGPGNSGDLTIDTRTLSIQNQASQNQESPSYAGATTIALGGSRGKSGNLTVNAESVEIVGNETGPFTPTPNERLALAIRDIPTGLTTATVGSGQGGDLTINTQRLTIQNGAGVTTGTVARSLENPGDGGNLTINATESVTLSGKAALATGTLNSSQAGKLEVKTPTLTLGDGAVIASDTIGSGNAGDLTINTEQLLVRDGSRIGAATGNSGTGANITIASDLVELVGTAVDDQNTVVPSGIFANSQFIDIENFTNELGDAGNINIDTENLIVGDGAVVLSSTEGQGIGGTITIDVNTLEITTGGQLRTTAFGEGGAGDITLNIDNRVLIANLNSGLLAETEGAGAGGTITINTPELTLQDQGQISAFTSGTGTSGSIVVENADSVELADNSSISTEVRAGAKVNPSPGEEVGKIDIKTRSLTLNNDSQITASTSGLGNAGSIFIKDAQQVNLDLNSSISTAVNPGAVGNGGDVDIETKSLSLDNTSEIEASTAGTGDAGSITIPDAQEVNLDRNSSISTAVNTGAVAQKDSNIAIKTRSLTLNNDSDITASTSGIGNAGSITIQEAQQVDLNRNSSISTAVNFGAEGNGGNVEIETKSLSLDNQSQIEASTAGNGNAGSIKIPDAEEVSLNRNSSISTEVKKGAIVQKDNNIDIDSNIDIKTRSLTLNNDSDITASTSGIGNAGSITIQEAQQVDLNRNSSISTAVNTGAEGNGGNVEIETKSLSLDNQSQIEASTAGNGNAGSITIPDAEEVNLNRNSSISTEIKEGAVAEKASNIDLKTRSLTLTNDSDITASTSGIGNAGSITIQEAQQVNLDRNSSISTAVNTGAVGNGGNVEIETKSLSLDNQSQIEASTAGTGDAGSITIPDAEEVNLNRKSSISTAVNPGAVGDGGNIDLKTRTLKLNQSQITAASTDAQGDAGQVQVRDAQQVDLNRNSSISTEIKEGAVAEKASNIDLKTRSLTLNNDSNITASTSGIGDAGSITIQEAEQVNLDRKSSISTAVNPGAVGNGGDIDLKTRTLKLNQSQITASTDAQGDAGSIFIQEAQQVNLNRNSSISTAVNSGADAEKAGNIDLKTRSLTLTNDSQITASTSGKGDAGQIKIQEAQQVDLNRNSSISTAVNPGAVGNGGDIDLKTRSLTLTNESEITSSTAGDGDAGNITLQAKQVTIQGDSQVSATTTSGGKGGNIEIIEANRFEATDGGNVRTTTEGTNQAGDITLEVRDDITLAGTGSGLFANTTSGSSGDGGNIFVDPRTVTIRDGAKIAVDSQGTGKGGNIELQAGTLTLNNQAELSAETASNQGGNITLTIDELLFLRRESKISTTAGTAQAGGNGGNITINAPFIIGIRQENSDITANAFEGNGGNINITTQGIIGLEFRENLTPLSDITASSEFGVDGTVNINAPQIDPSRGLSELPSDVIDVSQLIEKNLCAAGEGSEFIATGRGGLPISPNETLNPNATWDDWRITEQPQTRIRKRRSRSRQHQLQINQPQTNNPKPKQIVEAQGWVIGANGEVILTAHPVIVTPKGTWLHQVDCPMLHQTFK
ncbi:MAG: filamentous hemagglutinin N-terminal domain-containing protein [Moorea sp. SIO4A1]|uniref:two-partner secretion domain-containing protein n=2 Tax=unclassified Moorena TaxID=2683338 RepID=UPI00144C7DF6|nr:filamentous hemagglutinin N-terminal domain-containing protein [Moorena sp. SIO4A1]NEQ56190.1 filamentous hemagglutinin N-terminal domain-containing protein [Moorena sp. SIO4A1]